MKRRYLTIFALLFVGLMFSGYQCSSTEITSAKLYIQQKNYDKAIEALEKEIAKNPKSDEGYYWMGVAYSEKEDVDKTLENFNKSLGVSKKFEKEITDYRLRNWVTYFNRSIGFYNKAASVQADDSVKVFMEKSAQASQTAIKFMPDSASTYLNLATALIYLQKYDDAAAALETSVKLQPSVEAHRELGKLYYDLGTIKMDEYKADNNQATKDRGMEYLTNSIRILEAGKTLYPTDQKIILTLAQAYIQADKIDIATASFKELIKSEPENLVYQYSYGLLLLQVGDFNEALNAFKFVAGKNPEYEGIDYIIGATYYNYGIAIREKAEKEGKEDPEAKVKFGNSIPYLEKHLEKNPKDKAVWVTIAKVYSMMGETKKAEDAFKKVDEL